MDKERKALFVGQIERKKTILGIENRDIAKYIGVCEKTFREKIRNPERFSLGECLSIMRFLRFTREEREEVFL